jgi:two-component system response regulator HydG
LNVIALHLPPLRNRPEDIPILAHHFLLKYSQKVNKTIKRI